MPKRNLLLLALVTTISLVACLARDHGQRGRRIGEVLGVIERVYVEPVAPAELETAALEGIMARLDEHSSIVDGAARRDLEAALDQEFGGVGLELVAADGGIAVHAPLIGGPAWRAGILPGDQIVSIDDADTRGLSVRDAVASLRGDVGSAVSVGVCSLGGEEGVDGADVATRTRTVTLVREIVRSESVLGDRRRADGSWDWFVEGEAGVGLLRITSFGDRTVAELDAALTTIAATPDLRGLVIDLRGNPGGLLTAAIEVCDRFLDDGLIVSTRRRRAGSTASETVDPRRARPGEVLAGVPIAVVIDGLSASAAEIVAACLQDRGRAVVVGGRSFGKGTVQSIIPLADGKRLLKLTTAEYLRPADDGTDRRPHGEAWGVTPDAGWEIDVPGQSREALAGWRRRRDMPRVAASEPAASAGDLPRHIDPVLAAALAALRVAPADLGGQKETSGHADDAANAGDASRPGDGRGG